jgi:hypothetical protein
MVSTVDAASVVATGVQLIKTTVMAKLLFGGL